MGGGGGGDPQWQSKVITSGLEAQSFKLLFKPPLSQWVQKRLHLAVVVYHSAPPIGLVDTRSFPEAVRKKDSMDMTLNSLRIDVSSDSQISVLSPGINPQFSWRYVWKNKTTYFVTKQTMKKHRCWLRDYLLLIYSGFQRYLFGESYETVWRYELVR